MISKNREISRISNIRKVSKNSSCLRDSILPSYFYKTILAKDKKKISFHFWKESWLSIGFISLRKIVTSFILFFLPGIATTSKYTITRTNKKKMERKNIEEFLEIILIVHAQRSLFRSDKFKDCSSEDTFRILPGYTCFLEWNCFQDLCSDVLPFPSAPAIPPISPAKLARYTRYEPRISHGCSPFKTFASTFHSFPPFIPFKYL